MGILLRTQLRMHFHPACGLSYSMHAQDLVVMLPVVRDEGPSIVADPVRAAEHQHA
jgi:hypothetical protein